MSSPDGEKHRQDEVGALACIELREMFHVEHQIGSRYGGQDRMQRRLGKGLGSLLGGSEVAGGVTELDIAAIRPNPFQPRTSMDSVALEELRDSIRAHGVLQPVVVRRVGQGYELIAGERRWRASQLAKKTRIPAIVRDRVSNEDMLELALVENVQRRDLNPMDRARGYRQLMESLKITQGQVADKVGLKRSTIANSLRLLELPAEIQRAVGEGLISQGHARALLGSGSTKAMLELLQSIVRKDLSVREVERLVRETEPEQSAEKKPNGEVEAHPPWARALEDRLRTSLGTQVKLQGAEAGRGRISLEFYSRDELDRLCDQLAPRDLL